MPRCPVCDFSMDSDHPDPCTRPKPTAVRRAAKCDKCGLAMMVGHAASCKGAPPPQKVIDGKAPITELLKRNAGSILPMNRWAPEYMEVVKRLHGTTRNFTRLACTEDTVKRLVTALCYVEKEGLLSSTTANLWKIQQFMSLEEPYQLQLIDRLWNECTAPKTYDCLSADMVETEGEVAATDSQLPSSVRPNAGSGLPFVKGPTLKPWKSLGIGFRVDGQADENGVINSITRITKEGVTAQVLNTWFMLNIRGMLVTQTAIAKDTSAPRIYARAQDLFNETAVCISRSFFGATAFPERTTDGEVAVWAVDTTGLTGFDTEKHQLEINKPWRPGEKCFQKIPVGQVIGYVRIQRLGGDLQSGGTKSAERANGGWGFKVPAGAKWTYLNMPSTAKKEYVEAELAAWADGKEYQVPDSYDFKPA